MREVGKAAGEQVVGGYDAIAFGEQAVAKMRAQEPCSAGDEGASRRHDLCSSPGCSPSSSLSFSPGLSRIFSGALLFRQARGGRLFNDCRRTANAVIREPVGSYGCRVVQISSVDYDGIAYHAAKALQIERGEFFPLGKDQDSVGAFGGLIRVGRELYGRRQDFLGALHGGGIVGANVAAFAQQFFDEQQRRGFANVVGAAFEGEAEPAKALATKSPEHAANFFQEASALVFVDAANFFEQAEVVSALFCDRAKGEQVFGETRTAITDSGIQKARADA